MTMKTMLGVLFAVAGLSAQTGGSTFTATATVKAPGKSASVPVTIRIDKYIADADREKVLATLKGSDQAATQRELATLPDLGYITLGEKKTPIKYAYSRPSGDGRIVTVVTAQAILYLGGSEPNAKPKQGFDLALALLVLNHEDTGDGELAPAVKVKLDKSGAIVTDQYGSEVVRLVKIAKAK